nr:MAG: ORF1 [Torque teno midi virus]
MAFWWNRRRRWYTRPYRRRRRRQYKYRRPRRRFWRRGRRRTTRRRRRRRHTKVKRKKTFLKLLQWQPDSIRKCKIIGFDALIVGYNGTQHRNYTTVMNYWTYPRTAGGGGFATVVYSLQFLYEQYELRKNIWTTSNIQYELCRYTGSKIIFYRHPWASFVVAYQLMYPMKTSFVDYMETQPMQLLLKKRHIVIPSLELKPRGRPYVKKHFKPPKQMVNKWFFQHTFTEKPLLLLKASVCNLQQPFLGPSGENELVTIKCINITKAYIMGNWGYTQDQGYRPQTTQMSTINIKKTSTSPITQVSIQTEHNAVSYKSGWFQKDIISAYTAQFSNTSNQQLPIQTVRYNPKQDDGIGNAVWLCSTSTARYDQPSTQKVLIAHNQPLWLLLFGFTDFLIQLYNKQETEKIYYVMIQTKYFRPHNDDTHIPNYYLVIDTSFINGLGPYNSTPTDWMLTHWYPTIEHQQQTMSNIVAAGPFTYKNNPTKNNWELHYKYYFFFKWGGSQEGSKQVTDPSKHDTYDVPDNFKQTVQITDPKSQIPQTILHSWDYRRGLLTKKALKRMYEHLKIDNLVPTDSECSEPPKKQKYSSLLPHLEEEETQEISCLQELYKEPTFQDQETQEESSLKQLIQQQQQQQQHIKHNLILLMSHIKSQQMELQLHSGVLQ